MYFCIFLSDVASFALESINADHKINGKYNSTIFSIFLDK